MTTTTFGNAFCAAVALLAGLRGSEPPPLVVRAPGRLVARGAGAAVVVGAGARIEVGPGSVVTVGDARGIRGPWVLDGR